MPLSGEALEEERRKAKHLAMRQALQMIERSPNQLCSSCTAWQEKYTSDSRQSRQDIEHLRKAVQKMMDVLAVYISGSKLSELVQALELDVRVFTIHDQDHCFVPKDGSHDVTDMSMELEAEHQKLQQVTAERDLAKMNLYKVGRELNQARQDLTRHIDEHDKFVKEAKQRQRYIDKVEARIKSLETQSSHTALLIEPTKLKSPNLIEVDASAPVEPLSASRKTRHKIDAEHDNSSCFKSAAGGHDLALAPRALGDNEQKHLNSLESRMGVLERHGFLGRAPPPEILAERPCKPPIRAKLPKDLEFSLADKCPKNFKSRSHGGLLDSSRSKSMSSIGTPSDFERISYRDRDVLDSEVATYLSRSQLG